MNKIILLFCFLFSSGVFAGSGQQLRDLTSFPKKWSGEAGDLVTRVSAELVFDKVVKAKSETKNRVEYQDYLVTGYFKFGQRTVDIYKATTVVYDNPTAREQTVEVVLYLKDELVTTVFLSVSFDKDANEYSMKDLEAPPNGRRLFLKAGSP